MNVVSFNALPRKPYLPSGTIQNHWHFDLRYIPLEPTPSHVLFIIQPGSSYTHLERLPLGISNRSNGMVFFPETGAEAALEVSKALIHSFVEGFGNKGFEPNPPPVFAPWKLSTEDPQSAAAITDEFKKMGVRNELCKIHVARGETLIIAQKAFEEFWKGLKTQTGIPEIVAAILSAPGSIAFHNFRPATWIGDVNDEEEKALAYTQRLSNARPMSAEIKYNPHEVGEKLWKEMQAVLDFIDNKPANMVLAEADAGNAEASIDYALRHDFLPFFWI
jgi:hypothetical protein